MGQGRDSDLDFWKPLGTDSDLMLLPEVGADHVRIQPGAVDLDTDSHPPTGGSPAVLCLQVVPGSASQLQLGRLLLPGPLIPILLPGVEPVSSAHPEGGHLHLSPHKHTTINSTKPLGILLNQQVSGRLLTKDFWTGAVPASQPSHPRACGCLCFSLSLSSSVKQYSHEADGPSSEQKQPA